MKKIIAIALLITSLGVVKATSSLDGKIIALDAGHGGDYSGAVNQTYQVAEKDVNLAVVYSLKNKLESQGACVVLSRECDETILSRRERTGIVAEMCINQCGGECDALVSVHHNGSVDPEYDGTLVIYNERQDFALAETLHDSLISNLGLNDQGYLHGGYGITIFDHFVSALTEAYYITNDWEAEQYLSGTSTEVCSGYSVLMGDRIEQESNSLIQGISAYFNLPIDVVGKSKNK